MQNITLTKFGSDFHYSKTALNGTSNCISYINKQEEKTTQQPQDIDFNYSETTRRMFSTSMDGTTWNTSLDMKKITGSKGIK